MASGLAIACSNMPVAEEVLKDAGVYFNPENPEEIKNAIYQLIIDTELRKLCREKSYHYAKQYSWNICANDTFLFLHDVARSKKRENKCGCS
ncbi:MAG: glycosyl transferase, group 1 [uncultured bacterium]|nr:MAG: glycosyl transferase, group 1 [uncultured bacterium]